MALIDDLEARTPEAELSRRKALGLITGGAIGVAAAGTAITTVFYLEPNVVFEPPTRVILGAAASFTPGTLVVVDSHKLYVVRNDEGFFAMSSVCTHLGCMTRYDSGERMIRCPCHGSQFDEDGKVIGGPAPRPLVRKLCALEGDQLVVDLEKNVGEDFILRVDRA